MILVADCSRKSIWDFVRCIQVGPRCRPHSVPILRLTFSIARAEAPRKYPVNFAFSPNGTECLSHLADIWHETDEAAHTLSDDLVSMYNETSLEASPRARVSITPQAKATYPSTRATTTTRCATRTTRSRCS